VVACLLQGVQVQALLLQVVEGRGDVAEHRLIDRGERLRERRGQAVRVRPLRELRLAELDQEVDERVVPRRAEVEQVLIHSSPVRRRVDEHLTVSADRLGQAVSGERRPARADQPEVLAHPLRGDEEPVRGDAATGDRFDPAAQGEVPRLAVLAHPAQLQPRVPEPLVVAVSHQEVPLHPLAAVPVGLDPVRRQVSIQQERQHERQHLGLAGAVVAAQQQLPVAEVELLVVVQEEIDQARPQRLPAPAARRGEGDGGARGQLDHETEGSV